MSGATFFIESKESYFAFNEQYLVMMGGGCTGCHIPCRRALFVFYTFRGREKTSLKLL
ncbi:hypothetical protein PF008_g33263 [Phytophthora fragariae]|uniref:Uncharacterized protein n=1 Tax=Phytophthora fragariae TaxID=53985 RepID=A0A6G0PXF2_9STRA|nr:hypothetical protein PF008_g33263 [Phytophthora fragariae]